MELLKTFNELKDRFAPRGSFAANVLTMSGGTAIAQGIILVSSPILTRLYTPEGFGLLALYVAITSIFRSVVTLRYPLTIVLPEKDADGFHLLVLSLWITGFMSCVTFLLASVCPEHFIQFLGLDVLNGWLFVIPFSLLAVGAYESFYYWNVRKKVFSLVAKSKIAEAGTSTVGQIGIANTVQNAQGGLIGGYLLGQVVSVVMLVKSNMEDWRRKPIEFSLSRLWVNLYQYRRFPTWSVLSTSVNILSTHLPILLLNAQYGAAQSGIYLLSVRVLQQPLSVIGDALNVNLFQQIAEKMNKKEEYAGDLIKIVRLLAMLSFPFFLVLAFSLESLFSIILGQAWAESGLMARLLLPWTFLLFLSWPLTAVYNATQRQLALLIFNVVFCVSVLAAFLLGIQFGGVLGAIFLLGLLNATGRYAYIMYILHRCHIPLWGRHALGLGLGAVVLGIAAWYPILL